MIKTVTKNALLTMTVLILNTACQSTTKEAPQPKESTPVTISCTDPRPEICTQEYIPVCATKDTGVRCVTAPCPSTEKVTYGNACTACSDAKVYSHVAGACEK